MQSKHVLVPQNHIFVVLQWTKFHQFRYGNKIVHQVNGSKTLYGANSNDEYAKSSGAHSDNQSKGTMQRWNSSQGIVYNQGRWTSLEHFKFLEALKKYGKEWQKVQQHVSTRTSTQARSHAQKFFVKLEKKSLTLEEFLKDLDLKEVEKTLLAAGNDNIDYDEEREVNMIANKKLRGSVMNIALPSDIEDKKRMDSSNVTLKRSRSEIGAYAYNNTPQTKVSTKDHIRQNFAQYEQGENDKTNGSVYKRVKTSERGEYAEEKPSSEATAITQASKNNAEAKESPFRKLSISNFEPIQPKGMGSKARKTGPKEMIPTFGTPQPVRTDNSLKNDAFISCFNKLVFK